MPFLILHITFSDRFISGAFVAAMNGKIFKQCASVSSTTTASIKDANQINAKNIEIYKSNLKLDLDAESNNYSKSKHDFSQKYGSHSPQTPASFFTPSFVSQDEENFVE